MCYKTIVGVKVGDAHEKYDIGLDLLEGLAISNGALSIKDAQIMDLKNSSDRHYRNKCGRIQ
jgi:hypothetical protein